MNSRNDLLFVSIHGAFLTFDPLSCTSRMEGTCYTSNAAAADRTGRTAADRTPDKTTSTGWGGLVWNRRRKRPVVSNGGAQRQRHDDGWMRKDGNRRSANTGWVRGVNPNWDRPATAPGKTPEKQAGDAGGAGQPAEGKPRKVSDLASFLSALVLFGPNMTHMTH